ncbi:MAG: hypothetical protein AUK44_05615 [Porphyromonadaceae bacterium CG2_30_38_12]|nr:MAG: hypothetical protein AUK44_05615 [Porphyromonadaceae bacterium CG2_30_38_12]
MKKISLLFVVIFLATISYAQELVTNGNFEAGATGWSGNAANVVTENANSYNSANVTVAANPWDVNLSYVLSLTAGKSYQLKFDAWSDRERTMIVGIGLNHDPWSSDTKTVNLIATSKAFELTFIAPATDANSRIIFDMGAAAGFVGIDNVSLMEVTTTCNNGVQDGDETGIDCGGSCGPCVIVPTIAAPTPPARAAEDVVSIYSDAYTNITVNNFDAGWCGGAATTEVMIADNKTLKKNAGIVCQGIDFSTNRKDLTSFTHLHFDFYITDTDLTGDVFNLKLVNFNGGDGESSALEVNINGGTTPQLVANQWVSVDVPITALGGVVAGGLARNDVAQIGITTANVSYVWYDNIYLHKNTVISGIVNTKTANFNIYPNPVMNKLTIKAESAISEITIRNIVGQSIRTEVLNANSRTVDISDLAAGNYFVVAKMANGEVSTQKISKL